MTIVSHEPAALNKDFCLFSQQSRYLLLASKEPGQAPSPAAPRHVPMAADRIKDTVLHVIDMITGAIVSRREFRGDHINLTHNEGIYLHRNIIAVLRIATQEIELLRLGTDGTLSPLLSVGEFCHEDDRPFLARTAPSQTQPGPQIVPNLSASSAAGGSGQMVYGRPAPVRFDAAAAAAALANVNFNNSSGGAERGTVDASGGQVYISSILQGTQGGGAAGERGGRPHTFISGIKHHLLSHLWLKACRAADAPAALRRFHYYFEDYEQLRMWKMQLLDTEHLLIKYGCADHAGSRTDSSGWMAFFVIYNFVDPKVVAVYENSDIDFLKIYEDCADFFRQGAFDRPVHMMSTPGNCIWTRQQFRENQHRVTTARNGGIEQSVRRSLAVLPCRAQYYRESPYFDMSLFSYDEKAISHLDRLRHCSEFPAKFYSRLHGGVAFRIQAGAENPDLGRRRASKYLVNYIFHPYLPFAISVQHIIMQPGSSTSITNFHYRA